MAPSCCFFLNYGGASTWFLRLSTNATKQRATFIHTARSVDPTNALPTYSRSKALLIRTRGEGFQSLAVLPEKDAFRKLGQQAQTATAPITRLVLVNKAPSDHGQGVLSRVMSGSRPDGVRFFTSTTAPYPSLTFARHASTVSSDQRIYGPSRTSLQGLDAGTLRGKFSLKSSGKHFPSSSSGSSRKPRSGPGPSNKSSSSSSSFRWSSSSASSSAKSCPLNFDTRGRTERWYPYLHRADRFRHKRRQSGRGLLYRANRHTSVVTDQRKLSHFKNGLIYFALTAGPQRSPRPLRRIGKKIPVLERTVAIDPLGLRSSIFSYLPRSIGIFAQPKTFIGSIGTASQSTRISPVLASLMTTSRVFSTSRPRLAGACLDPLLQAKEAGFQVLFLPLIGLLKSSAALHALNIVSRIALTILPFSVRAKYFGSGNPKVAGNAVTARFAKALESNLVGSRTLSWSLTLLGVVPLLLLGGIIAASLERTPITGRWRNIMLSPAEEAELVSSVFAAGETDGPVNRDWVAILRSVLELGDEGVSPITGRRIILGGEVLDDRDWRVRWTNAVLKALEQGVPALGRERTEQIVSSEGPILQPPPTKHPLRPRITTESAASMGWASHFVFSRHVTDHHPSAGNERQTQTGSAGDEMNWDTDYELIVIDRAEANAFSFGFGPNEMDGSADSRGKRGVIVLYTGFIDQILGNSGSSEEPHPQNTSKSRSAYIPSFFSFFTSRSSEPPQAVIPNLVPTVLPTADQTKAMAVLLSHELSHLILSHSVELHASTSLLLTHVSKLATDVVRTITFPLVAMLGPFLSDAINSSMKVGTSTSWGYLGTAMLACKSRVLETEADLVALRLLAQAGIDPHFALRFWEDRLRKQQQSAVMSGEKDEVAIERSSSLSDATNPLRRIQMHSAMDSDSKPSRETQCWMMDSHPVEAERVERIEKELERWEQYQVVATERSRKRSQQVQ